MRVNGQPSKVTTVRRVPGAGLGRGLQLLTESLGDDLDVLGTEGPGLGDDVGQLRRPRPSTPSSRNGLANNPQSDDAKHRTGWTRTWSSPRAERTASTCQPSPAASLVLSRPATKIRLSAGPIQPPTLRYSTLPSWFLAWITQTPDVAMTRWSMFARPCLRVVEEHCTIAQGPSQMGGETALAFGPAGPSLRRLRLVRQELGNTREPPLPRVQPLHPLPMTAVVLGLSGSAGIRS